MSSFTRGKARDKRTAVRIVKTLEIYYLFNTKDLAAASGIGASDLLVLGHIDVTSTPLPDGAIAFLRANAPKPPRVSRKISRTGSTAGQNSVGTFCAVDKLQDALRGGWNFAKQGRVAGLSNNARTVTAVATISNGALYSFPMNKTDFDTYKAALKLEDSTTITTTAERSKLFRGGSLPRPGKAKKVLTSGTTAGSTFSSFYSHDAPLTDFQAMTAEILL